ncbi:Hypothetical predicted protein [Podarcis lilfordi]|uniref:Uncharacterized protein n=1 Tax=Podarcis lilfordi TaxID=74358 RepID=A0AA35JY70_9SAUR|nr:Hypothetical predicted protein [Podarcis lilfordi]
MRGWDDVTGPHHEGRQFRAERCPRADLDVLHGGTRRILCKTRELSEDTSEVRQGVVARVRGNDMSHSLDREILDHNLLLDNGGRSQATGVRVVFRPTSPSCNSPIYTLS